MTCILRALLAALCCLLPAAAFGQGAVLQGGPWAPGRVPMYVGQNSSQAVIMDGGSAAGGAVGTNISEIGVTARGTGTPPYVGQGSGPFGTNICDYDAPTNNPTGYHFFCLSANAQGGGLFAYGAGGSASQLPLQFSVNGVTYQFPFSIGGILGPPSSTIGDIVTWNNTVGTLVADTGVALSSLAPLASPHFTGVPTAPTADHGTSNTQIATTAFAQDAVSNAPTITGATLVSPTISGATISSSSLVSPTISDAALTGIPTAPTAAHGTNTTQVATTAFALDAVQNAPTINDATLTGTPVAPTPATNDSSTKVATTAFTQAAITTAIAATGDPRLIFGARSVPGLVTSAAYPATAAIIPVSVYGSGLGKVIPSLSPFAAATSPSIGSLPNTNEICVSPTGVDTNTGIYPSCVLTLSNALSTKTAAIIDVYPGTYAPANYAKTDAGYIGLKVLRAINGQAIIRVVGPALSSQTWTATSGQPGVYQTTLTLTGSQAPQRIYNTGPAPHFDAWGFPARLKLYTSVNALQSAGYGWFFDSGSKIIYVALGGANVDTSKGGLNALYLDSSGFDRVLANGTSLVVSGDFLFDGVQLQTVNQSTSLGNLFMQGGVIRFAYGYCIDVGSGVAYISGTKLHACSQDGINADPARGTSGLRVFVVEHDIQATMGGDIMGLNPPSMNNQGSSWHGCADGIRMGGLYANNWGQEIADTTTAACSNDYSWLVGVSAYYITQFGIPTGNGIQASYDGTTNGSRTMWCDTCEVADEGLSIFATGGNVTLKYYNPLTHGVPIAAQQDAVVTPYDRLSP